MKKLLCKLFGHRWVKSERPGKMWAIQYVRTYCERCGYDCGEKTVLHDD